MAAATQWEEHNGGLGQVSVQVLLLDPASPATLYAGTYASGVYKSTDSGARWARIPGSDLLHPDVTPLALEAGTAGVLYLGTGGGSAYRLDPRPTPK